MARRKRKASWDLTDRDMLQAAKRQLKAHDATRPATTTEARAKAAAFRREEAKWRTSTKEWSRTPPRPQLGSEWSKNALDSERIANDAAMQAESWERIAANPNAQWEKVRADLILRVDHYQKLVDKVPTKPDRSKASEAGVETRRKRQKAPKKEKLCMASGYAYELDEPEKHPWKTAKDDYWDIVMVDGGPATVVGTRKVDGVDVYVFKKDKKYFAQTTISVGTC